MELTKSVKLMLHRPKKHTLEPLRAACMAAVLLGPALAEAQEFIVPFDDISRMQMIRDGVHRQTSVHSGIRPVYTATIEGFDQNTALGRDTVREHSWARRKLFEEHFVVVDKPGLRLVADPIFNFGVGGELERSGFSEGDNNPLYINTRGFSVSGKLGDAVYIYTDFTENQARFPAYLTDFVNEYDAVPGMGRVKPFGEGGFDYSMASGFVGFNATDWLTMQGGHYKHFVGHGTRSLLLSDNAFNYPFAGYLIRLWGDRIQLRNNVALMQSLDRLPLGSTPESLFKRKRMSFNYLSIKPFKSLEIGFYEAVMWQAFEEGRGNVPFDYNALNPLIFVNTLRLGLDDEDNNATVGFNAAWQPMDHFRFYGQFMRDRGGDAGEGYQIGVHAYSLLSAIDITVEYNEAEAGSYASANVLQGFTHLNQPLAHPMGSGFREILGAVTYYRNGLYARAEWVYADLVEGPRDPLMQQDAGPAESVRVFYQDYRVAYVFNERNQMQVYAGITDRHSAADIGDTSNRFWYFGLKSRLPRTYRNF